VLRVFSDFEVADAQLAFYSYEAAVQSIITHSQRKLRHGLLPPEAHEYPLVAQLELTSKCNLNCRFCYNRSGETDRVAHDLNSDEIIDVAKQVADLNAMHVVLTGGEVFCVTEELFTVLEIFRDRAIDSFILTNGWACSEAVFRRLCEFNISGIQVSIDGPCAAIHDNARGRSGSWARAVSALYLSKECGFYTIAACVILPETFAPEYVSDYIDMCYYLGADEAILTEVMMMGRAVRNASSLAYSREMLDTVKVLRELHREKLAEYGNRMFIGWAQVPAIAMTMTTMRPPNGFVIQPDGNIQLNCLVPVSLGNVRERRLAELWETRIRFAHRDPEVARYVEQQTPVSLYYRRQD